MSKETEVRGHLCEACASILGLDEVRPEDDFFEIGGHSLVAGRLAAEVYDSYGVRFRLADFYEEPTMFALARLVSARLDTKLTSIE